MIRTLIVDDEPIARAGVRTLLAASPDIQVVGECGTGTEAVAAIRRHRPELVFLDVQMPDLDGFGVLAELAREEMPAIVFVTAYDAYALRAFEVNAIDYLLKPFDRDRFSACLERVRRRLDSTSREQMAQRAYALLTQLASERGASPGRYLARRILVRERDGVIFVREDDIYWIEVRGNYLRLHLKERSHLVRETMTAMEEQLPSSRFLRVSRSCIINTDRVRRLRKLPDRRYRIELTDGTELDASRRYGSHVARFFGLR